MENLMEQGYCGNGDIDVEMAVLALCMRNNTSLVKTVQNKIISDDFTDDRNSIIFGVILEMFFENRQIDRITVYSELERRNLVDKAGGQRYIYRVGDTTAVQSALDGYIDGLKERSARKKILKAIDMVRQETVRGSRRSAEIVDLMITEMSKLKEGNDTKGIVALSDVLKMTLTGIYSDIKDENAGKRIKLGYPKLDAMLGGLGPGTLHILAGRPGMGKTAFAINIAANVAANQKTVVVFSLEMSLEQLGARLMSSAMPKPVSEIIKSRQLTESDRQLMDQALKKMSDYPLYLDESSNINPGTMKAKIRQMISAGTPPKLVIVDYLQLINPQGLPGRSRNDEVAAISRNLKLLAKEFGIPIIALSQMSRDNAKRNDHTPQISDLRDSGAIEQDADTIMFVDRPDYFNKGEEDAQEQEGVQPPPTATVKNDLEIKPAYIYLAKNRHGQTGKDSVWWIPSKTMFYEYDGKDPVEPGIPHPKTVDGDAAAQNYDFEKDEEGEMDPPLSEDEGAIQEEENFMAYENNDYPEGFMNN